MVSKFLTSFNETSKLIKLIKIKPKTAIKSKEKSFTKINSVTLFLDSVWYLFWSCDLMKRCSLFQWVVGTYLCAFSFCLFVCQDRYFDRFRGYTCLSEPLALFLRERPMVLLCLILLQEFGVVFHRQKSYPELAIFAVIRSVQFPNANQLNFSTLLTCLYG